MSPDSIFASTKARLAWESIGGPYCDHPSFSRDANGYGVDEVDYFCLTCGAIKVGRNGDMPEPRWNW